MLNENIKTLRKAKGLSQEELAIKLNVVRQTVSKWEKGLSVPDAGMLIQLADALDTNVNTLLGEPVEETEEQVSVKAIAAKLELMNEQFAKQGERRRKIWRTIFVILGVIALFSAIHGCLDLIQVYNFNKELQTSAAIGGIDAATGIYVSNISLESFRVIMTFVVALISGIGIYHTRKK